MNTRTSTIQPRRITVVALAVLAGLIVALLNGAAPKAYADTPDPAPITNSSSSSGGDETEVISVPVKVVASAVASATATASSSATGSAYATAVAQVQNKNKIKKSSCFWSTGTNTWYENGHFVKKYDPVKSKVCKLKKAKKAGGKKWYYKKVGGGTSGRNCGNLFKPEHKKVSYKRLSVLDVKSGATACVDVWAKASVAVTAQVNVTLEYTLNGKTTRITKSATGKGSASDSEKARACNKVTKKAGSKTLASKVGKTKVSVRAKASANARATAIARARAQAVASISLVIKIEIPKPVEKPTIVDITQINDVDIKGTTRFCATVRVPGGDTGTLTLVARFGAFEGYTGPAKFENLSGQTEKCVTYKAPTEVPKGDDKVPPGKDKIMATIVTNKGASDDDSTIFTINDTPQPPN